MRAALTGLTARGRSFLAAAAAAALAALVLSQPDLLRVAVLLAALPLLAVWYVGRARCRMACLRTLTSPRIPAGAETQVRLRLQNLSPLPTGAVLLEDRLPYPLGRRPRLVLERLGGHKVSSVWYSVRSELRGRYEIGPLGMRLTDPFGLCELTRSFSPVAKLIVYPRVVPLPPVRLTSAHSGAGESRARSVAVHGEDDAATREYRHGDDLRRVHWRSTARVGELMVRREEQPWESRATVLLDTRAGAHHGEGPAASFEWAVSAAASVSVHLRQAGYQLQLITAQDEVAATGTTGAGPLLDYLAEIQLWSQADLGTLLGQARRHAGGGLVLALLGQLTLAEAELLARLRGSGARCVGFLLDSSGWQQLPPDARTRSDREYRASVATLVASDWRVVEVRRGAALPTLWPQVARNSPEFSRRPATTERDAGVGQ